MQKVWLAALPVTLVACSPAEQPTESALFASLSELCGQAFEGRMVSDDPRDADWAAETLVMHVRTCSEDQIRIPLHVGDDRSRTWVITRMGDRLELKHDHRHEDGSEDVVTQYGGTTHDTPTASRAEFPADQFSRTLFDREGIAASMANVWSITLEDGRFTYALDRPDRHFAAEFDLTEPVDAPPPPWGSE